MISKNVATVLENIRQSQQCYRAWKTSAEANRKEELEARARSERDEKEVQALEVEIDRLSLELRRVLNGEESTIPVELPKEVDMSAQVGREG